LPIERPPSPITRLRPGLRLPDGARGRLCIVPCLLIALLATGPVRLPGGHAPATAPPSIQEDTVGLGDPAISAPAPVRPGPARVGHAARARQVPATPRAIPRHFPSAVAPDSLGVNMQWVRALGRIGHDGGPGWGPFIALAAASGVTVVRDDALWADAEPTRPDPSTGAHTYTWSQPGNQFSYDAWAGDLAAAGIRWQPIVDYSAPWASIAAPDTNDPPASDAEFATYAAALARRYGRGGDFWKANPTLPYLPVTTWEIWNEENLSAFWGTGCSPAAYGDLFLAAQGAIRGVDPDATVIIGGLADGGYTRTSCSAEDFVSRLAEARPQALAAAGGLGFHPYGTYLSGTFSAVAQIRRGLDDLGQTAMPLYLTEFGWDASGYIAGPSLPETSTTGQPNRADALRLSALNLSLSNCLVRNLMIHTWITPERNPRVGDDWYGIAHPTLDPATGLATLWPSGQALADTFLRLEGYAAAPPPSRRFSVCSGR
jgi:hypothetical protein